MRIHPLTLIAAFGILAACDGEADKPGTGDDTDIGRDTDTGDTDTDTDVPCEATFLSVAPADGTTAVYYREPIVVSFEGDASTATIALTDAGGMPVSFDTEWSDGNVQAVLSTVLAPDTIYTLSVDVCGANTTTTFSTSSLGTPLAIPTSDLLGRAYVWRLSDATITQPAFLDFVASTYLIVPLLISVSTADDTSIDLLGGVAEHENDGSYTQVMSEETWDFPAGDFSQQPYFEAYAEYITVSYSGIPIPIEDFRLSGTFTADGSEIQEGVGTGLADTRHMGPLVGNDIPEAVCLIAAGAGVVCEPCADGEAYCIYIIAEGITAVWEEGLTMVTVE